MQECRLPRIYRSPFSTTGILFATLPLVLNAMNPGIFQHQADVGSPALSGSTSYNSETQTYRLEGGGYNIWFDRDEFHFAYNYLEGDFILTAHVTLEGEGVDPHRKVGWMVRESLDDDAVHFTAALHGDGLTVAQWRPETGASMRDPEDQYFAPKSGYRVLQVERAGTTFVFRAAHPGEPLQEIGRQSLAALGGRVFAGLFICAHNPEVRERARAWNVRIDQPVSHTYNPQREGFLGSRLETVDVFTGLRRVIYDSPDRFEAPNWMPGGDRLLFNQEGGIYTIPIHGNEAPTRLDTRFANRNNNDHGISFDGKLLAISHHREDMPEGGSTIYVLPLEGGEPRRVTEETPSYWHGWAPDNKHVVYVARRGSGAPYNIFRAHIDTREEEQVSRFQDGHVDGPEYSPDGEWIYYNGSQTGTMQIWRMRPDGSGPEQLTFDAWNDWFPHISPDGRWVLFLSYPPTINPHSHPFYKRVMLRLMPLDQPGAPRVVAHLYGGQGTINVPSWSPDSRSVAFVSNSRPSP